MIVDRFSKYLTAIEYPKEKTSWNIAGIIKGSNAFYRFDVREMFEMSEEEDALEKEWLILDLEELHEYIRREKKKEVYINDLISDLEWTIFLQK